LNADRHLGINPWVFLSLIIVGVVWVVTAPKKSRSPDANTTVVERQSSWSRSLHLLFSGFATTYLNLQSTQHLTQIWWLNSGLELLGYVLLVWGAGLSIWSKLELGEQWRGQVEVRKDHKLVQTGVYKMVRHPIYSGLLSLALGCAFLNHHPINVVCVIILFIAFKIKLTQEESFLRKQFPNYSTYATKVPQLIPSSLKSIKDAIIGSN